MDKVKRSKLLIYHDLINAIVKALDARDLYTAYHSDRVAEMSLQICHLLKLSKIQTEEIHIAAHLHDIGKIGIPDKVLLKEEKLTNEEWAVMKTHPDLGYYILKNMDDFKTIAKIVRYHHEKFNGGGYPHNLKEEEIPLGARIIAVADSIDAMLSNRVYRLAFSEEKCYQEIAANADIFYDPQIVNLVLANWSDILAAREISREIKL